MKIIDTSQLDPEDLSIEEREWVYNGLDACVTAEVLEALLPQLTPVTQATYDFSRSLQGPVLDMGFRGILVDKVARAEIIEHYHSVIDRLIDHMETLAASVGLKYFNWRAYRDVQQLFYDKYRLPPVTTKEGGLTTNRAALDRLQGYTIAYPMVTLMKKARELIKRIDVLKNEVDKDGRMRTSYNIAGTTTGRFSSFLSEFGTGGNLQNIEEGLRSVFIADPGYKLANFDAEQGESRVVGAIEWNLFKDGTYLDACESGDMHILVARIVWPELGWTGDLGLDRRIAREPYDRHHSRRDKCKILGHGSNYGGRPETLSTQAKVSVPAVIRFQDNYFKAFPAHRHWHQHVENQLRMTGKLTTLTGRLRHFFGRRDDDKVLRDAIAFDPQGSLVDIVNRGMLKVWLAGVCQLLLQLHDAIVVQYPEEEEDDIIPKIKSMLELEIPLRHNRTLMIPYGTKVGWNWGKFSASNPDGLKDYKSSDKRRRSPSVHILDR